MRVNQDTSRALHDTNNEKGLTMDTSNSTTLKINKKAGTLTISIEEYLDKGIDLDPRLVSRELWRKEIAKALEILRPYLALLPYLDINEKNPIGKFAALWDGHVFKDNISSEPYYLLELDKARLLPITTLFFRNEEPPKDEEFKPTGHDTFEYVDEFLLMKAEENLTWVLMTRALLKRPINTSEILVGRPHYRVLSEDELMVRLEDGRQGYKIVHGLNRLVRKAADQRAYHHQTMERASDNIWRILDKFN
jgi:hypothetical protein